MRRDNWVNLNGKWDYTIQPKDHKRPKDFDGAILVPFPVESALSGVAQNVGPKNRVWYRRTFSTPPMRTSERLLLHFGAVDWDATVWINGQQVASHRGGFDPFTIDITDVVHHDDNELVVSVWDPTDSGYQPRGKQVTDPKGIWYTAVTGIWQTVWLEVVPEGYIKSISITPNAGDSTLAVTVQCSDAVQDTVKVAAFDGETEVAVGHAKSGDKTTLTIPNATLWSPAEPKLYDLVVSTSSGDRVESYFGLRDIGLCKDSQGITRIALNGEPLFQYGLLDQGWWPDGLYTAPTDEALRYDLEITKKLGFNMVRKHVKIAPYRWYYWCDRLGLLVWQDMPSGDRYIGANDADISRTEVSATNFEKELEAMVRGLMNHPSIVMWVPYNEGWGQWDTARVTKQVKSWDPSRLVNSASGWVDRGVGDVHDIHRYPGPAVPRLEDDRAAVLGEFGGLGLPISGHTWQVEENWGYRNYTSKPELNQAYRRLVGQLRLLVAKGLSAAVYTQTTDVEIEVNGILTYDREVLKLDQSVARLHELLYLPPPQLRPVVAASIEEPETWRYTFDQPNGDWTAPDYNDSSWQNGQAGFGGNSPPGAKPRTRWTSSDIWLRRTVKIPSDRLVEPALWIYHDEDATVYINGKKVASLGGYTLDYALLPFDEDVSSLLEAAETTISVHCRNTNGAQFIDVGIVDVAARP